MSSRKNPYLFSIGDRQYTEQEVKACYDLWKHLLACKEIDSAINLLCRGTRGLNNPVRAAWLRRNRKRTKRKLEEQLQDWQMRQDDVLSSNNATYFTYAMAAINDLWARKNGSMEYTICIKETLTEYVTVTASSSQEAKEQVEAAWENSEYVLGAENFQGVEFDVMEE